MRPAALLVLVALACDGGALDAPPVVVDALALDVLAGPIEVLAEDAGRPLLLVPAVFPGEQGLPLAVDGSRQVLRAHAESAFEVEAGPFGRGARLVARTFVFSAWRNDPARADPAPVDFRVLVDGVERASIRSDYVLEPGAESPFEQLMRDLVVDLTPQAGRRLRLRFETTRGGEPLPAGADRAEPVWWDIVVRQPVRVPRQAASPERPNILVLCVDTLAARRMSLHGYARETTPALVAFARRALVFDRAGTPSSWTLPATASLLTGLPPNTHGVLGDARSYLVEGVTSWPERLAEQGLEGAAFSANALVSRGNNFHQGFGHWEQHNDADAFALDAALLRWIDTQPAGARWFAYVHLMDPHAPYGAPGEERLRFALPREGVRDLAAFHPADLLRSDVPPLSLAEQAQLADLYDGEVAHVDRAFAALLDALGARGELERTVIVLTADHGEELFEHGHVGHGHALWEELLHVPLLLAGPGVPAGVRSELGVSTEALANTLLHLAGVEPLPGAAPALLPLGDAERRAGEVFALTRTHLFGPRRILACGRDTADRKLILELSESGELVATQAFDLAQDPGEGRPLEGIPTPLLSAIEDWFRRTAAARPPEPQPANPAIEEELRQTGYVGR